MSGLAKAFGPLVIGYAAIGGLLTYGFLTQPVPAPQEVRQGISQGADSGLPNGALGAEQDKCAVFAAERRLQSGSEFEAACRLHFQTSDRSHV